jgi:putative ABC transport system permease protein
MYEWNIVGIFAAGNTAFNSEIWGDAEQLMQAFRRPAYSSVIFKLRDPTRLREVKERIEANPRLTVDVEQETESKRPSTTSSNLRLQRNSFVLWARP